MVEVAIAMSRDHRVATFAGKCAARKVARTRVQFVVANSLEHDLVEIETRDHQVRDRRTVHDWLALAVVEGSGPRQRNGHLCLGTVPSLPRLIRANDAEGVASDSEREH